MSSGNEKELKASPGVDDDASSSSSSSESDDSSKKKSTFKFDKSSCSKLTIPEHFVAYIEDRDLDRDIEPIQCSEEMIANVFGNYVIVKNILSHLRWREKMICKDVCSLWNSIINRLQNEQLGPVDFSVNLGFKAMRKGVRLHKSSEFYTEPMAVFTFCNTIAMNVYTIGCAAIVPNPCSPACKQEHSILDIIYHETTAPRDCMYAVKAYSMSYLPLPQSNTMENVIRKPLRGSDSFFCGLYIPKIPGVEFKTINLNYAACKHNLMPEIQQLTSSYIVKGVVACLTDNYLLCVDEDNAECLRFLHAMQPDQPFAFGGCLAEDTANKAVDYECIVESVNQGKEYISGNIMSLGIFLIPKGDNTNPGTSSTVEPKHNFEIYSVVLESGEWSKLKIRQDIQEFSKRVPRFTHSVAIKFSCMGRQHKHEAEQHWFRHFFPNTPLVGCFGNGELGINHPSPRPSGPTTTKRAREDITYEKVHSYSTVFFYIAWGKILEEAKCDD